MGARLARDADARSSGERRYPSSRASFAPTGLLSAASSSLGKRRLEIETLLDIHQRCRQVRYPFDHFDTFVGHRYRQRRRRPTALAVNVDQPHRHIRVLHRRQSFRRAHRLRPRGLGAELQVHLGIARTGAQGHGTVPVGLFTTGQSYPVQAVGGTPMTHVTDERGAPHRRSR